MNTAIPRSWGGGEANPQLHTHPAALQRFQDQRFGMFIHWGPVTLRGEEIGWSRGVQIPKEDYDHLYQSFNPVLFDARAWVRTAKQAGMRYLVLTTRHHDGFCLWHSRYTDYDMAATPYGKDIVRALADECRRQEIDFGFYYSILDWHHPDYPVAYPDPNYEVHVERELSDPAGKAKMERFVAYVKDQLKELIETYDPPLIWFDGEWEWAWTHRMGMDLYAYLRGLKDDLLINNRVDKGREGMGGVTASPIFAGDYATPEQQIGTYDDTNPWESCITIGQNWSWKPNDTIKTKKECLHTLLQTAGGDGNLLLNIGPMFDGRMEQRQITVLQAVGDWLAVNGDAVYGTRGGPYQPTEHLVSTRKHNTVYLHLLEPTTGELQLPFVKHVAVTKAYLMDGHVPLTVSQEDERLTITLPNPLPGDTAWVVALEVNTPAADIAVIERLRY